VDLAIRPATWYGSAMTERSTTEKIAVPTMAATYVGAGGVILLDPEPIAQAFAAWGYGDEVRIVIGLVQAAAGAGLLAPKVRIYAAVALLAVMIGAVVTHVQSGQPVAALPAALLSVAMAAVAWVEANRTWLRRATGAEPPAPADDSSAPGA